MMDELCWETFRNMIRMYMHGDGIEAFPDFLLESHQLQTILLEFNMYHTNGSKLSEYSQTSFYWDRFYKWTSLIPKQMFVLENQLSNLRANNNNNNNNNNDSGYEEDDEKTMEFEKQRLWKKTMIRVAKAVCKSREGRKQGDGGCNNNTLLLLLLLLRQTTL